MNSEPISSRCPKCQAPLPADAPHGLCPRCLLAAVSAPTDTGQPADPHAAPPLETIAAAFPQLEIVELIGLGGMGAPAGAAATGGASSLLRPAPTK